MKSFKKISEGPKKYYYIMVLVLMGIEILPTTFTILMNIFYTKLLFHYSLWSVSMPIAGYVNTTTISCAHKKFRGDNFFQLDYIYIYIYIYKVELSYSPRRRRYRERWNVKVCVPPHIFPMSFDILLLYFAYFFTNMTPIYKQEQTTESSIL